MINRHDNGELEFSYYRPSAQQVNLVGDFNDWTPAKTRLCRDDDGWWRVRLALRPGEYRFKYLVDEHLWEADFAAFGVESDGQGGWDSVLWLPIQPISAHSAA